MTETVVKYIREELKAHFKVKRKQYKGAKDSYFVYYKGEEVDSFNSKKDANTFIQNDIEWNLNRVKTAARDLEDLGIKLVIPRLFGLTLK